MVIQSKENLTGTRAFLIGVILALAVGILGATLGQLHTLVLSILTILGLIVGFSFLRVSDQDVNRFLLASVSLVIVSFAGIQSTSALVNLKFAEVEIIGIQVGKIITSILGALLILLIPATIVVAIKSMFSAARK